MATIRSIFKNPEGSVMASVGVMGTVFTVYQLNTGTIAEAHATDANHPALEASRKKAGYTAFVVVTALSLITRDGNVATLGYASIIGMEMLYRHSIMADPGTGRMQQPTPGAYQPAGLAPVATLVPADGYAENYGY